LGVKDGGAGRGFAPVFDPDPLAEAGVNALPDPGEAQAPAVAFHGVLVGEVVRQGAPLAPRLVQIEERVEELAPVDGPLAPGMARWRQQRGERVPLHIGQIGGVCLSAHTLYVTSNSRLQTGSKTPDEPIPLAMPAQEGVRLGDEKRGLPTARKPRQEDEYGALAGRERRPLDLAPQHDHLLAKERVLGH